MSLRPDDMVSVTAFGPRAVVCRRLFQLINLHASFFPLGRVVGGSSSPRKTRHTSRFSAISDSSAGSTQEAGWPNRRCNQHHLVVGWQVAFLWVWQEGFASPIFPGYFGHVAKPQQLRSLYSEKWLNIQGFTKFTALCISSRSGTPWTL